MKKLVLRYGIVGACVSITLGLLNWFTVAQSFSVEASQITGYASIILSLMCVPLGIRYFKHKLNSGIVPFKKALKIGTSITLVNATITFLYSVLFFVFAGEEFANWRTSGMNEEALQRMNQAPDFVMSPLFQGLIMFLSVFFIGLIISLVSSVALSGTKKPITRNLA
ncbi:DUF4199 domain-containing protein [Roseivirga sp. E12]|uniref:DUF4199 domain-containing protein n=1 Tax=Roseivirga sp. E12 TaxID=2819237 RepID=UPI001ABBE928|nr:DUF4199 domain-containing protein [Roseivirga sp. E12]MBO3698010.1 DUF4199 domain-containing protein [Roseivirga sp. E12]